MGVAMLVERARIRLRLVVPCILSWRTSEYEYSFVGVPALTLLDAFEYDDGDN